MLPTTVTVSSTDRPGEADRLHAFNTKRWQIVRRGSWWAITPRGLPLPCASWREAILRATQRPQWAQHL